MSDTGMQTVIERAFDDRQEIGPDTTGEVRDAVAAALDGLDRGELRVAEKKAAGWTVNQWLKKAVLLSFRLNDMTEIPGGPGAKHSLVGQGTVQVCGLGK